MDDLETGNNVFGLVQCLFFLRLCSERAQNLQKEVKTKFACVFSICLCSCFPLAFIPFALVFLLDDMFVPFLLCVCVCVCVCFHVIQSCGIHQNQRAAPSTVQLSEGSGAKPQLCQGLWKNGVRGYSSRCCLHVRQRTFSSVFLSHFVPS